MCCHSYMPTDDCALCKTLGAVMFGMDDYRPPPIPCEPSTSCEPSYRGRGASSSGDYAWPEPRPAHEAYPDSWMAERVAIAGSVHAYESMSIEERIAARTAAINSGDLHHWAEPWRSQNRELLRQFRRYGVNI